MHRFGIFYIIDENIGKLILKKSVGHGGGGGHIIMMILGASQLIEE